VEIAVVVELSELVPLGDLFCSLSVDGIHNRQRNRLRKDAEEDEVGIRVTLAARVVNEFDNTDGATLDSERCADHGVNFETDPKPGSAAEDRIFERFRTRVWFAGAIHLADDPIARAESFFHEIFGFWPEAGYDHQREALAILVNI
jgi:hypothetical protein